MLRHKPILTYSGLTIVLSNPSRFDKMSLLSGMGGQMFNNYCLRPDMNIMQCDVRLMEDTSPWLDGTKCILLLGEAAMHHYLPFTIKNSLGELRGSPFSINNITTICSFFPQDAADARNWESQHNPQSKDYVPDNEEENDTGEDFDSIKRHGATKRGNYAFWLKSDVRKCKTLLATGGIIPPTGFPEPVYHLSPTADEIITILENTKGSYLWFDIETDYEEQNMQCFSFSFDGCHVYGVIVLDYNYKHFGLSTVRILRALAIAIANNILVAHNGAAFDFFVLAHKYRIPIVKTYDTMIAMHRCFPDIEKSLGHVVSLFTWERFHKDEDSQGYNTEAQMGARVRYCCKDVYTMFLVHKGIEKYAKSIPGLQHSIDTAMACIRPYLLTTLQGIRVDVSYLKECAKESDELMMQYNRIINLLIGKLGMTLVHRAVKKPKMFAGSNAQCCEYFHNLLCYPVVARSLKTQEPSLGKKAIFKLRIKHENPVLDFVIAFRTVQKEFGTYKFIPWKNDDGSQGSVSALEDTNTEQTTFSLKSTGSNVTS